MTGYDAIVIGAGHNGLTAAVLLQRAGLRTACLDAKRYAGGMASTVELFDGYRFEIAGSVQFPTSSAVSSELGLDSLPTVDLEVMSVALRGVGDDPVVQFTDPTKMLTHLHRVHGADAVTGMAGLLAWSQAPTRALGRFEAGTLPKSFDEMYACATNEFERSAIDDMLFGSVTDVLDRHFPDREKHGALRGSMTVLAVNTLYRGPATPGSAAALAFGLGVPEGDFVRWKKLRGGIGALTTHLSQLLERTGGEVRLRSKVTEIVVDNSRSSARVRGVRTAAGSMVNALHRTGPSVPLLLRSGTRRQLDGQIRGARRLVCAGVPVHAGPNRGPGPRAGAAFRRSPQGLQLGGRYFESRYRGVARYWYRDCQAVAAGAS